MNPGLEPGRTQGRPPHLVLGPLLRFAGERDATVWVETSSPCSVQVLDASAETFTVHGRHFALVIVEGLEPGTTNEYTVELDGVLQWPPADSDFPPSVIRTAGGGAQVSVLVGSCRAAAPHEEPYILELDLNEEGRGVDSLWAHARRMLEEPSADWPHLLLLLGDQIYADDSSPAAKQRIEDRRSDGGADLESDIVERFEEYCWLYHEAWSEPLERWLLSTVPSAMIFDDHDMIDDWNISGSWVRDMRSEPWWERHAIDGFMSYWIYQHLGNLSPATIEEEGILAQLVADSDGTDTLRSWAERSEAFTPVPGNYRFSHVRTLGDVTVIFVDCRNARHFENDRRLMVAEQEWAWVVEQARAVSGHLVLATSVPVFISDGLHDLQVWNERVCDGRWGAVASRLGERLRRALDLEDWSAFAASYAQFIDLVEELRSTAEGPKSIIVASGDIHFSYAATLPTRPDRTDVWQIVSSPIRNALISPERSVMRSALTRSGARFGDLLRRSVGAPVTRPYLVMHAGPLFANNMCELHYRDDGIELVMEQASADDDGEPELREVAAVCVLDR